MRYPLYTLAISAAPLIFVSADSIVATSLRSTLDTVQLALNETAWDAVGSFISSKSIIRLDFDHGKYSLWES